MVFESIIQIVTDIYRECLILSLVVIKEDHI